MTETHAATSSGTPRHLWVVGIVALLWNSMGALDYYMTQTKNAEYLSEFEPELLEWFYGLPTWVVAAWATAVWGGVLGTLLLLLRKRLAVPVYLISMLAMVSTAIHNYGISNGLEVMGDAGSLAFTAAIFLVTVALYLYARAMRAKGVLT